MIEHGKKNNVELVGQEVVAAERRAGSGELAEKAMGLYRNAKDLVARAYEKVLGSQEEKKKQELLAKRLEELVKEGGVRNLKYKVGDGIVGGVAKRDPKTKAMAAIRADDFVDCCALILQTPDAVGVLHISPLTLDELEGRPTYVAEEPRTRDRLGFIRAALQEMASPVLEREVWPGMYSPQVYKLVEPGGQPGPSELKAMEESLKVRIISGNPDLAGSIAADFQKGGSLGLDIEAQTIDLSTGDKKVVATTGEVFVVCDDKRIVEIAKQGQ